ncbi:hypothetical protein CMI37_24440 [Candidatus Pacearchaeota archaeon]|nr:hypothetical protein [Candidatus Pacearchaeota archaeon]
MAAKRKASKKVTKNMKNLSQAHGKEEKFEPTTLEQIWGDDGSSAYGTLNENQYTNQVDEMNMSDLQTHASTVGIIPIDNRHTLRERLLREFRKHVSSYKKPVHQAESTTHADPEVMKILSEGK